MTKPIHVILAVDKNSGIAKQNDQDVSDSFESYIPWDIREDMVNFKKITLQTADKTKVNAVIMGRKTYEAIPEKYRPLHGRLNVVVTSKPYDNDLDYMDVKNVLQFKNLHDAYKALDKIDMVESVFICGGVALYNEAIASNKLKYIYLTRIPIDFGATRIVNLDLRHYVKIPETNSFKKNADDQYLDHMSGQMVPMYFEKYINTHYLSQGQSNIHTDQCYTDIDKYDAHTSSDEYQYLNLMSR